MAVIAATAAVVVAVAAVVVVAVVELVSFALHSFEVDREVEAASGDGDDAAVGDVGDAACYHRMPSLASLLLACRS